MAFLIFISHRRIWDLFTFLLGGGGGDTHNFLAILAESPPALKNLTQPGRGGGGGGVRDPLPRISQST